MRLSLVPGNGWQAVQAAGSRSPALTPRGRRVVARKFAVVLAFAGQSPDSQPMGAFSRAPRILAVLGPTNTGKTHLAIERMLGHATGMIGFPLRLLARENYDRVVRIKGARQVALVTGEEKIIPDRASYFVCTVESMPLDRQVDFLA